MSDLPPVFQILVPEAMNPGVYANGFSTWFSDTEFTLDFLINLPAQPQMTDQGQTMVQPMQVVSRVKFSPSLIFRLMQNLNDTMTNYEGMHGAIKPSGPPIQPPGDGNA
jgi:hypothetical protein